MSKAGLPERAQAVQCGYWGCAMLEEPVSALVRRPPVTIQRGESLGSALATLKSGRTRCVVVMDGKRPMGLLTDRDLVEKCFHEGLSDATPVETIMDSPFISVSPETPVIEALRIVDRERIRHLPLVEADGTLRAVIRGRDLMDYLAESMPELVLNQPPDVPRPVRREGG